MPSDALHPLQRDRKILVEVFNQLLELSKFYQSAEWDNTHILNEMKRVHLRLIAIQWKIEELDLD